jgi:hypothetical protein
LAERVVRPNIAEGTLVRTTFTAIVFLVCAGFAQSKEAFNGPDLSGVYSCQGDDSHEGKYTAIATLQLIPEQSLGKNGAYMFKLEVPGYGTYPGHAATQGTTAAIYFANTDPGTKDFGTGIASFRKNNNGKWTFKKFYYEPEFKDGNYGFESCIQK